MWEYNYSYLSHSDHKYVDKYRGPSGKMIYVYDKMREALNTPVKDVIKFKKKSLTSNNGVLTRRSKSNQYCGRRR